MFFFSPLAIWWGVFIGGKMRYDERKAYIFVEDFLSIIGENCCEHYRLSESTVQLALVGLAQLRWSSRWLSGTPENFDRVSPESFSIYQASYYERAIKELTMSCDNEIKEGLIDLGDKLLAGFQALAAGMSGSSGGCGCEDIPGSGHGSGSGGTNTTDPTTNEGSYGNPGGDPLPGFESKSDSDNYQCAMAQLAIDDLVADISRISTITAIGVIATELAGIMVPLLFTPLAWVDILLLATVVLEAAVIGIIYSEVVEFVEDNRDALVCSILFASTVGTAIEDFKAKVSDLVPGDPDFPDSISQYIVIKFINSFATYDNFNRVFEKVDFAPPPRECDCADDCLFNIPNGTLIDGELDGSTPSFTVEAELYANVAPYGDLYRLVVDVTTADGCGCREFGISQSGQTALPPEADLYTQMRNCAGTLVQEYDTAEVFDGECFKVGQTGDAFFFFTFSTTPFTVTFTWGDVCS